VDLVTTLGDLYLYIGDGQQGVAAYRDAYQLKARLFSAEAADEMFSEINLIAFVLPANPPGHPDWSITVGFDVAPDSRITIADYQSDAPANTNKVMRANFERARARPRFVSGGPWRAPSAHYVYRSDGNIVYSAVRRAENARLGQRLGSSAPPQHRRARNACRRRRRMQLPAPARFRPLALGVEHDSGAAITRGCSRASNARAGSIAGMPTVPA
jgi:hypothetical protein